MNYFAIFFAGAFLCNSVPHLACGLRGEPFPSPFAKPPGKGNSSPLVNFLWGALNLILGALLLSHYPVEIGLNWEFAALVAGVLIAGVHLSLHFGKVRRENSQAS
jgi:hypothetical protein